jgi:hypothetical protein
MQCVLVCGVWQVVMTSIEPKGHRKGAGYDAFEYTAHSHTYMSDSQPTAKFTYDLSPIQVRLATAACYQHSTALASLCATAVPAC